MKESNSRQKGFDEKLARIEEINRLLSEGKLELEKSVSLFEEGMALAKAMEEDLGRLERRIEIVTNDPQPGSGEALEISDFTPETKPSE